MSRKKSGKTKSGFAIVVVLIFMVVFVVIVFLINSMGIKHLGFVKKQKFQTQAKYAAESGIARGLSTLKNNIYWDGTTDGSGSSEKLTFNAMKMPNSADTYTVTVFNNFQGTGTITTNNGVTVPPGTCYLLSKGQSGLISSKYIGVLVVTTKFFEYGIFADESVKISGNVKVTSYDSSTGFAVAGGADVATNGLQDKAIDLNGTPVYVDGNLISGYGSDPSGNVITVNGQCTVTGDRKSLSKQKNLKTIRVPKNLPPKSFTDDTLLPGDYSGNGLLKIVNGDIKLIGGPGGNEYIINGIQATGHGKLVVDATNGPVKIYLTDDMKFSAHSGIEIVYDDNSNIRPGDVQFLATKEAEEIELNGVSKFYGAIYAPESTFRQRGNTEIFGGLVSKIIQINGSVNFNYDVGLKTTEGTKSLTVGSWQYY